MKTVGARRVFERVFREYGLPLAIRTDNGVPFASNGLHGLSQLNVWWIRLGIQHQRIRPASPQENGAHERVHKTLKIEALRPAKGNLAAQQRAFSASALSATVSGPMKLSRARHPAQLMHRPCASFPCACRHSSTPLHLKVKRVTNAGTMRFKHKLLFIANALKQNYIGLEEVADGIWSIFLGAVLLGRIDERQM